MKDVELSPEWKEVSFKLDEGLEFGLVMPYKVVISSEQEAEVSFGGAYIRR